MKYNQELPIEVEAKLDAYMERIKAIKWFQPSNDIKKEEIEKQVSVAINAFGCKATIEYRSLKTPTDWNAAWGEARDAAWGEARDAAWDAAWGAAWDAVWDAGWDAAWDAAWDAVWDAGWDAARDAAWGTALDVARGALDLLALELPDYKSKYPNGNFITLIPLYEAGLYPVGIVDGKFLVYVPPRNMEFPEELK